MSSRRTGGPAASVAGPLPIPSAAGARARVAAVSLAVAVASAAATLLLESGTLPAAAHAADWVPPRPVSVWLSGATIGPGNSVPLELVLRAEGAAVSVDWSAVGSGNFSPSVAPAAGSVVVGANAVVRVPLTVGVPPAALGLGSVSVTVTYANGGGLVARTDAAIVAATNGRPEIWPLSPTWSGTAGSSGSVGFQIRSQIGTTENLVLTGGRSNPDPNNAGAYFPAGPAPTGVTLPAGGTVGVAVPVTLAGTAWAGNANTIQMSITSSEGLSVATAHAFIEVPVPDSLPTALRPVGLVPLVLPPTGRDGPVALPLRNAWLLPDGTEGIRVWRASSTDSIGVTDLDANGADDRLVGTIRIPSIAAALTVVPGFVTASAETLDLGLLAAGRAGLMLLDLRTIEDPTFGSWEDFFDTDYNGVDDRILRTIPLAGFATDVAWTRSASGRVVAFVAAADSGSNPVSPSFDPLAVVAGSGAGVVAIDVTAAVDSLSGLPLFAGSWNTPGSALDVEVRGEGVACTIAVADGSSGLAVADVSLGGGAPAAVSFSPRAQTPLSSAWGAPYARDVAWIMNTAPPAYAAVAAEAGGLQLVRIPAAGAPSVVLAQQTAGGPCGVAATWTGLLAAAQGASGAGLFQCPGTPQLDLVTAGAAPPYTAPVTLARDESWPGGSALERASFASPAGGATAIAFEPTGDPSPDLFVCDRVRVLVLRPGASTVTSVAEETPPAPSARGHVLLDAFPVPSGGTTVIRARVFAPRGSAERAALPAPARLEIVDVRGRVVRVLEPPLGASAAEWRSAWDGRDRAGRRVGSGRYWARVRGIDGWESDVVTMVIVR